jgi:hypothetical protein
MENRILITGGPVSAPLDAVKIITNKFRGGLMAELAARLSQNTSVTYLTSRSSILPEGISNIVFHDGFSDYMQKVLAIAPTVDAVILGAAVVNLIPKNPFTGKFPSHNYKPGDIIPIDFTIAPRVIDMVHQVAPRTLLFGFKLLQGVQPDELVKAAYGICLEAKCHAVFANDANDLAQIIAVTRERATHPVSRDNLAEWIRPWLQDEYYSTKFNCNPTPTDSRMQSCLSRLQKLINVWQSYFISVPEGLLFGTVAVRCPTGFLTTARRKNELDEAVYVSDVNHQDRIVYVQGNTKASLNAPLLSWLFANHANCHCIIHFHKQSSNLETLEYAPPGTLRDSMRHRHINISQQLSFNIENHGTVLLLDRNGNLM